MPTDRIIATLSLIMSTLTLAVVLAGSFSINSESARQVGAIVLPTQTFAKTLDGDTNVSKMKQVEQFWLEQAALGYEYYVDPATGLVLPYYRDFQLMGGQDEGGEIILIENAAHNMAVQVFIQPWDEPGPLTLERVTHDLPNLEILESKEFEIFYDATPLLFLETRNEHLGDIPEAWFIRDGYLYQISMYAPHEELLMAWFNSFIQAIRFTGSQV